LGTQQFIFIVVSVFVVGLSVAIGVNMFTATYTDHINDILIQKIHDIGGEANRYRMKPAVMGGGGKSYKGFKTSKFHNDDLVEEIKIKALKYKLDLTLTLKSDQKKSGKLEASFDDKGVIYRLRIYDPDEKKWTWLVNDKKDKKEKKEKNPKKPKKPKKG